MRTRRLAATFAAGALAVLAAAALAQDPASGPAGGAPHGAGAQEDQELSLSDLTKEQRNAVLEAWGHVVCDCPNENWSKTLANCPDGCSNRQKQEVLHRVVDGWDLGRILEEQARLHGSRAVADPGAGASGTWLVIAGLVLGAGASVLVLRRWTVAAARRHAAAEAARETVPSGDAAEVAAVERELREIE